MFVMFEQSRGGFTLRSEPRRKFDMDNAGTSDTEIHLPNHSLWLDRVVPPSPVPFPMFNDLKTIWPAALWLDGCKSPHAH